MQRELHQDRTSLLDRPERNCPVCGSAPERARVFLDERIDASRLNQFSFASRKEPEFFNYRMVQCATCDLVYVDFPPSQQALAQAYHVADYDSSEEANDAADAYIRELRPTLARLDRGSALEIGTGTGVLLDGLAAAGFRKLVGIEPSTAAVAAAPPHRRPWIREGIFREKDFEPESFDLVCCFMTLEHVREPMEIAKSASRLLRPGGAFVTVTHDYRSVINRMFGRRSPIIDIEHMQLFSNRSIGELLTRAGYAEVRSRPFVNRYTLAYWTRLLPLPSSVKRQLISIENAVGLGQRKLSFNVGNTIAVGYRTAAAKGSIA